MRDRDNKDIATRGISSEMGSSASKTDIPLLVCAVGVECKG